MADDVAAMQETAEKTWISEFLEGPTRTRWSELPVQAGDPAPDPWLPDTSGTQRSLSEWWNEGPVLVLTHRAQYCEDFPPTGVLLGAIAAAKSQAGQGS
ncbi:MAG: hypothetical protein ACC726_17425 [Chloroflexota bacterium]